MGEQRAMLNDKDWRLLEGDACRVMDFRPMAEIKNGKVHTMSMTMPHAGVTFECTRIAQPVEGFICHKLDFWNLNEAMKAKSLSEDTEVLMFWNKKQLRGYAKLFSKAMPRFCFMLCPKGAFELLKKKEYMPHLGGEARFLAMKPIMEWTPDVMK